MGEGSLSVCGSAYNYSQHCKSMYPLVEKATLKTLVMYTLIASLEELLARKAYFPHIKSNTRNRKHSPYAGVNSLSCVAISPFTFPYIGRQW